MYSSSYSKSYSSSRQPPSGSSGGSGGGGGLPPPSNTATNNSERPSTLNLPSGATTSSSTSGMSGMNLPNKPSRYTPVYPTLSSNPNAGSSSKSSSYTNLPTTGSPYASYVQQRVPSSQLDSHSQQVITAPPKSILGQHGYESRYQQYYQPSTSRVTHQQPQPMPQQIQMQQAYTSSQHHPISNNATSKSAHNLLIDSIPDVFCLSCPPAEFKFSDAYRAKTLPRTGKEVMLTS